MTNAYGYVHKKSLHHSIRSNSHLSLCLMAMFVMSKVVNLKKTPPIFQTFQVPTTAGPGRLFSAARPRWMDPMDSMDPSLL